MKKRLCLSKDLYSALINALGTQKDIVEDVKKLPDNEPTSEIPF